jgi:hypothetical protein
MKTFRDLLIWQKSIELIVDIYKTTESLPGSEEFALKTQMRRCSISIPSNIAEGLDVEVTKISDDLLILLLVHCSNYKHNWKYAND